jgi:regulator of replication initiation timing
LTEATWFAWLAQAGDLLLLAGLISAATGGALAAVQRGLRPLLGYAAFLSGCCEECQARHFDPSGVAKVIEYSARMVADQERLSSRFAQIKDLIKTSTLLKQAEAEKLRVAREEDKAEKKEEELEKKPDAKEDDESKFKLPKISKNGFNR